MKKSFKKIISTMMAAITLLALFSTVAFAKTPYNGQCGNKAYWSFDSTNGNMTISGEGDMWDFRDDADFFDYHECGYEALKDKIKSVTFGDKIEYIGADAFSGCVRLNTINWGKKISGIGCFAFLWTAIESVVVPNTVTYLGQQAFSMCPELKKAKLSDNLGFLDADIFDFDDNLTEVDFGKADPSCYGCGTMGRCKSLVTIKVDPTNGHFYLKDGVLYSYSSLWQYPCGRKDMTFVVPAGTEDITSLAFGQAEHLRSIYIPSSVKSMTSYPFMWSKIKDIYFEGTKKEWDKIAATLLDALAYEDNDNNDNTYNVVFAHSEEYKLHLNSTVKQMEEETKFNYIHDYKKNTVRATLTKNGYTQSTCTICGKETKKKIIYRPADFILSFSKTVYTGKEIKPVVTVRDSKGDVITNENYTVSYKNNVSVGEASVIIKFKGNYSGTKTLNFAITPKTVTGLKAGSIKKTSMKISWAKTSGARYYKVEQSTDGKTWKTVATVSTNSATIKSLEAGTNYQFRVTALDSTKKIAGKASAVLKTGTLTASPTVTLKSSKSKTVTSSWKKVTGASKYIVYKSTDGKKWTKVTTTTKLTYTLTKLTGGKKIYVKVTAVNAYSKESAASKIQNVTVKK